MNKEQLELLGDVYRNYLKKAPKPITGKYLSQPEFIHWIKKSDEFVKIWECKIQERVLDIRERMSIYFVQHPDWVMIGTHQFFDIHNIPTKLITVTYRNKTIESYE